MFVIDPFGNIPLLLAILKNMPRRRQFAIIIREMLIGLALMVVFLFSANRFCPSSTWRPAPFASPVASSFS